MLDNLFPPVSAPNRDGRRGNLDTRAVGFASRRETQIADDGKQRIRVDSEMVDTGRNVTSPERLKYVPPVYPAIAVAAKVEGVVLIEAVVGVDGRVQRTRVSRSVPLLEQAAVDAVKQWEYTPALLNGSPVACTMTVSVNFSLP